MWRLHTDIYRTVQKISAIALAVFLLIQLLRLKVEVKWKHDLDSVSKCEVFMQCPDEHFAFKITSGVTNKLGPKICLDDNVLMSPEKYNVGRGMNIALVNGNNGKLIKTGTFDLYREDTNNLVKFLKSIKEGTVVMIATFDDTATKLNDEARMLISELGSSNIGELKFRDAWVFVGGKTIKTKSPFEKHVSNTDGNKNGSSSLKMHGCIPRKLDNAQL